jgi:hypothetical protein
VDARLGARLDPEPDEGRIRRLRLEMPAVAVDDGRAAREQCLHGSRHRRGQRVAGSLDLGQRVVGRPGEDRLLLDDRDVALERRRVPDRRLERIVADALEDPRGEGEHGRGHEDHRGDREGRDPVVAQAVQRDKERAHGCVLTRPAPAGPR